MLLPPFNQTRMELKLKHQACIMHNKPAFNQTRMELKQILVKAYCPSASLLIRPEWN